MLMEKDLIKIKKYLLELGFQPNLKGYHLLSSLIEKAHNGEKIMPLKYFGYVSLSEKYGAGCAVCRADDIAASADVFGDLFSALAVIQCH